MARGRIFIAHTCSGMHAHAWPASHHVPCARDMVLTSYRTLIPAKVLQIKWAAAACGSESGFGGDPPDAPKACDAPAQAALHPHWMRQLHTWRLPQCCPRRPSAAAAAPRLLLPQAPRPSDAPRVRPPDLCIFSLIYLASPCCRAMLSVSQVICGNQLHSWWHESLTQNL